MSDNQTSSTLRELYQGGLNVAQGVCGIITTPVEYALRPYFGTRYFDPIQMMFTCLLMMLLPLVGQGLNLIPLGGNGRGYIGLGTLSMLFFLGSIAHSPRLWRKVFKMELEKHSQFEGEPLPFFERLPLGQSFWAVRVLWEPAFVAVVAISGLPRKETMADPFPKESLGDRRLTPNQGQGMTGQADGPAQQL